MRRNVRPDVVPPSPRTLVTCLTFPCDTAEVFLQQKCARASTLPEFFMFYICYILVGPTHVGPHLLCGGWKWGDERGELGPKTPKG